MEKEKENKDLEERKQTEIKESQSYVKTKEVDKEGQKVREVTHIPEFLVLFSGVIKKDLGFRDDEAMKMAKYLSGDTWTEVRKLQSRVLRYVETKIDGEPKVKDEMVNFIKNEINMTWRDINDKQKIGLDYLGPLIEKYYKKRND